jgi:hypothetical protein
MRNPLRSLANAFIGMVLLSLSPSLYALSATHIDLTAAAAAAAIIGADGGTGGTPTSSFCEAADCGSLPPSGDPGGIETSNPQDPCIKATSFKTCQSRCKCQYDSNFKKCKTSRPCQDLAQAEKNACDGGCLADWVP